MADNWWEKDQVAKTNDESWWKNDQIAKPQQKPEDIGIVSGTAAALGRGFESFGDVYGGLKLGATHTLGSDEDAAQQMAAMKADKLKPQEKPAMTWADMERIYADKGLLSAAAELPKYATESIAQSAPEMATPLAVGAGVTAASAPVVGPFAPIVGGAAGILTYGIQQAGHFLTTQGEEKKNPEQLEVGKALATAAATAPLGYLVDKWTLGLGSLTEKQVGKELLKRYTADEIGLGGVAAGASATVAKGVGKGFFAEAPVEVVEQVAERWQAGQDLNSPEAIAAYKEAWFGAGVSGGVMKGTVSGYQAYQGFNTPEGPAPTPTVPTTPVAPTPPAATAPLDAEQAAVDEFNRTEEERAAAPTPVPVATPVAESAPATTPVVEPETAVETPVAEPKAEVFTVEDPVAKAGIHKEFDTLEAAEAHVDTIAANRTALIEGHQDNIAAHNEDIVTLKQGLDTEIAKGNYGTPQFLTHEANINNEISLLNDKIMTEQAQVSNLSQPVNIVSPTNAVVEVKAVQATPIAPTPITPVPAPLEGVTEPVYTPTLAAKVKQLRLSLLPTLERFGLKYVGLNIVASIENGTANAHYVEQVMQIAYNANDPMGSLRHESIHALKELGAFTENEWRVLSQKAKDTWVNQFISEKNQAKYEAEYKKRNKPMDGFDAYLQEEAIAEAFKHFANTKPPAGLIGQLYSRLNNMFASLGNAFKQLGYTNADAIFQKIERGEAKPKKVEKVAEKVAEKPVKVKKAPEAKKVVEKAPEALKAPEVAEKVAEKPEAHTGTMETNTLLNKQGKEANEEYDNIKDIDKPWAKELVKRFENIQRKVFTSLSAGTINRLASTVVGEKVRVGKTDTQAFGTFDGKASPNMRIPMSYMTEDNVEHNFTKEQAELMLVVLGTNLNQEAQAASLFTPVETGADTFRIRLDNKILNERDAAAFDKAIGYPVNVYQDENGHGIIDINLAGNDPFTSEEALKSAMGKVFPNAEYVFTPCKYESIYITSEQSDYSDKSYKEIVNEWKKGESTGGTRNGLWKTFDVDFKPSVTEIRNLATARNKEFKEFTQEARRRQEIEKKVVEPEVKAPVKKSELEAIWNSYRHTALPFSSLSKEDIQVLARVKDKGDEAIDRAVQKIYKAIEQAPTEAEVEAVAAQEIDTKEVAQEEEEVQPEEEEEPQAKTDKAAIKTQKALDKAAAKAQKVLDKAEAKIEAKALKLRVKEAVKQAKRDVDNSELGQALQRVQNADFDLDNKNQIRAFYKKLVKNNILDEGGDTQENLSDKEADANDVLNSIDGELQDAYDNALQERIDEVTKEAEYQTDEAPRGRFQFKEEEKYIPATLTEKFKRWFGNSEIVNRDGTPKVMYHATARDITIFTPKQANAIFLTDSPDFAQTFAETSEDYMIAEAKANMSEAELDSLRAKAEKISKKEGTSYADELYALIRDTLPSNQNIMPVYVSAKNVFDFENPAHLHILEEAGIIPNDNTPSWLAATLDEGKTSTRQGTIERVKIGSWNAIESESVQAAIKKAGFDGFYVLEGGKKNLGVYTSNQIKSAIGNTGEFDVNNPDIRYQFKEDEEFVEPSGKIDNVTYLLVDKFVDLKRVIQSINKRGKVIADKWNAYLQEELYHSKVSTRIDFFMKRQLNPVLKQMDAAGITVVDMDNYLLARHASEANAHIANVNADPSANAGMTNDEALEYMDAIPANKRQVYERIANQIDSMTKETREMMVSYGLEKQGVIDSWEHAYKHYVPLMREQDESDTGSLSFGTGKGYSVKGKTVKARIGSSKAVVDVLANIALQRERIIARGEKNRVGQSLLGLVLTNPNKDFWVAVNPHIGNKSLTKELTELGLDPSVSQNLGEAPIERVPNAKTGEAQTQINPLWRKQPNVFITRVNGEDRVIIFNMKDARAKRMAVSFSNLTTQNQSEVLKMEGEAGAYWDSITKNVGKGTRWFASINTQYNPAFGLYNLLRDIGGATLNLQSTALKGKEFKVITNAFVALRAVYKDLRLQREGKPADSAWAKKFEEFELAGGKTGFSDLFNNSEEKAHKLQEEINSFGKHGVKQTRDAVFGWLSDFNSAIENCIRVSAYDEGIKSGLSQDQAASLAKNLTVNFNRTGARTKLFTPLYAFFNASVQGTARIAETMYKDGKLTPAGKKIVAGSVILGVIQAVTIAAAGFDENDPPEWVKDKNIIIPYGNKKYIAIPMPLGFNIFPSFARRVTEFAMSDEKNIGKAATSTFTMILDGFNPLGSGTLMQTALPTLLDPIAAIAENRDFSGRPIARDDVNSLEPTPGYSRAKENASSISTGIAYAINILTGGTEFQKGFISPTPDTLDYLAGQATGGVGREIMKIGKAGSALATGEELSTSNVPIVGRMIGNANQKSAETARFYENIKRLNEHKAEIEGRAKSDQEIDVYMEKHPESALYQEAGKFYKQISDLHKAKKELKLMGADKEDIKALDDAALEYMVVVNEIVRDFKHNN